MKKIILSAGILTFIAQASLAQAILARGIKDAKVVVEGSGGAAAVQPYAFIEFKYASCSQIPLKVTVEQQEKVMPSSQVVTTLSVSIVTEELVFDCFGSTTDHKYQLQISSDFRPGTVVNLKNPLAVEYK